jgi:excinuclease ABC subunit A
MPIDKLRQFFDAHAGWMQTGCANAQAAASCCCEEIRTRLKYLCDVGIGYLTLDRQSRTLSGGEVQRINLTTALGHLAGQHACSCWTSPALACTRATCTASSQAMQRLRDAGNTLGGGRARPGRDAGRRPHDRHGPGPGESGGSIVFDGTPEALKRADTLTGAYLGARKQVGMGFKRLVTDNTPRLILEGAREHNLQNMYRGISAAAPGVRHRRQWLGQIHLDSRRAGPGACCATLAKPPKRPARTTACWAPTI